jgi:hypothetical protein
MPDPTVEEVDQFIAEYKTLAGFLPEWQQVHGWNWSTRWGVLDKLEVQQAELIFTINAGLTKPSITAVFRKQPIYRVDIVPQDECKWNDYGALTLGLPARVCGPHTHPWPENRAFVAENGFGHLPFRKPVEVADVLFIRALEVAAMDLNIHVEPVQRVECEPPAQAGLFAEKFDEM